jgi:hypothetical protein
MLSCASQPKSNFALEVGKKKAVIGREEKNRKSNGIEASENSGETYSNPDFDA